MTASQNLLALYRSASTRYHAAVTTAVESGDTCTLVVLGDGADWEDSVTAIVYARQYFGVPKGTGIGEWQPVPVTAEIAAAITSAVSGGLAGYASESYVDSAVTGLATEDYVDGSSAGRVAVPGAGSVISLGFNTARNPSAARSDSRPTRVTVSGTWAWNLTATGTQSGTAAFKSDSSGTPTTTVISAPFSRGISVGLSVGDTGTIPWSWSYEVPSGHSYLVATSGTGTWANLLVVEQIG
jgi:hypothetical protein